MIGYSAVKKKRQRCAQVRVDTSGKGRQSSGAEDRLDERARGEHQEEAFRLLRQAVSTSKSGTSAIALNERPQHSSGNFQGEKGPDSGMYILPECWLNGCKPEKRKKKLESSASTSVLSHMVS